MATCDDCQQEMMDRVACTDPTYHYPDRQVHQRLPHDGETGCHDCGTPPGGLHHPGCDVERCPRCRGQAISCGCGRPAESDG